MQRLLFILSILITPLAFSWGSSSSFQTKSENSATGGHGANDNSSSPNKRSGFWSFLGGGNKPTRSASNLSVNPDGLISGPKVVHDTAPDKSRDQYISSAGFPGGKASVVTLHKTAGKGCTHNNTKAINRKAHFYVCKDGTIIQTKSIYARSRRGEQGFNAKGINIEFEAAYQAQSVCKARGEEVQGHCYERLSANQMNAGKRLTAIIAKAHNIPLQPVLPATTPSEYLSRFNFINTSGRGYPGMSAAEAYKKGGIVSSHQTSRSPTDRHHHDDSIFLPNFNQIIEGARRI